jgi:hypothetical protein
MKNVLLTIILIIVFPSFLYCQKNLNNAFGSCKPSETYCYWCDIVEFNKNNTFNYIECGLFIKILSGTYLISGDTIILNSYYQPKILKNMVIEEYDSTLLPKHYKIQFFDRDNNKTESFFYYNDELVTIEKYKNEYNINTDSLKYIAFMERYNQQYVEYKPISIKSNYFKIYYNYIPYYNENETPYLVNEKWLLKGKKLYIYKDAKGNFDRDKYYFKRKKMDTPFKYYKWENL